VGSRIIGSYEISHGASQRFDRVGKPDPVRSEIRASVFG